MAEANGSGRLDDHEERLKKLEAARKEMEDTMIVMAHLEAKAASRIKEHAEFLSAHEEAILANARFVASHEASMKSHELAMREFDEKLNALINIVGRMQGGMESRPH